MEEKAVGILILHMDAVWYLDNEDLSGLASCSFEEVRWVFNRFQCFVDPSKGEEFVNEAQAIKDDYEARLAGIDAYQVGEYERKIRRGEDILYSDEPTYMVGMLETEAKGKLIDLIRRYFSRAVFESHKSEIPGYADEPSEETEDAPALRKALAQIRNQLYAFLSHVDYYMRHCGYFAKRADVYSAIRTYSEEIGYANREIGFGNYFYFLGSWGRPGKRYDRFVDVDPISMEDLIMSFCKSNTKQLAEMAGIFGHAIRTYHGEGAFERRCQELQDYVRECEAKGLMRKVNP